MRILFDQGAPVPLRRHLPGRTITTASEMGRAQFSIEKRPSGDCAWLTSVQEMIETSPYVSDREEGGWKPHFVVERKVCEDNQLDI